MNQFGLKAKQSLTKQLKVHKETPIKRVTLAGDHLHLRSTDKHIQGHLKVVSTSNLPSLIRLVTDPVKTNRISQSLSLEFQMKEHLSYSDKVTSCS